ncbi:protein kinase [Methanobacterium alkalithermotolerans]|uniref:Protein kinase n=1 Tax=Methanobacterium alkalithermotolerans TaxID=2731220 RepID=A0A8T8K3J5_9EURY|nr:DUF4350 domain-containing protein [Methanobacterium alkalithermotolerans]QUH23106.1 protein kinase [Methanobacterium alkalithermotolerans]
MLVSLTTVGATREKTAVIFDETGPYYNMYTIFNIAPQGSSIFANLLETNGFYVSRLKNSPITYENLRKYDVLILMAPGRNYTADEIKSINQFVSSGGGLFLVADGWGVEDGNEDYAFNQIAHSFGLNYSPNQIIVDPKNNIAFQDFIKISDIKSSPLTADLKEIHYLQGPYIQNTGSSEVLAYSSSDSWGDWLSFTDQGYSMPNYKQDLNETSGPLPVISTLNYGKGRVVFFGAAKSLANFWIYRSDNWKLGVNSVSWLANQPPPTIYNESGLLSPFMADLEYYIMGFLIYTVILLGVLIFKLRSNSKDKALKRLKTIKNWKYNFLMGLNAAFLILGILIFIPSNIFLFDVSEMTIYDPNFGYFLLTSGILFVFLFSLILYNLYANLRIKVNYNYLIIFILLLGVGFTAILGDIFSFPMVTIFSGLGLFLILPFLFNLIINHIYGSEIIIKGKEFNRLEKLSFKSLPYELHSVYEESSFIGEGGFGRVFKAKKYDGQVVAIKIPKSFDKRSEKIFISEVSNWENLEHQNIVKLYDYKILPIPYLEMEYCKSSLFKGPKPVQEVVFIIYEVARGLNYAHRKNIIHGDIKNSNIMSCHDVYKISDWGLSKLHTDKSVTLSGVTPQYAAPEHLSREFGKADKRTDIYQLGIVFYEQLTGEFPFKGEISHIYDSILNTHPVPPSLINPEADIVEKIVLKCLSKNKNERYESIEALMEDLQDYYKPTTRTLETTLFDK